MEMANGLDSPQQLGSDPTKGPEETTTTISDLPEELLAKIANYVLGTAEPVTLQSRFQRRWSREIASLNSTNNETRAKEDRHDLKFLLVNKAFYFAGIEAFYSNKLCFANSRDLHSFIASIGSDRHASVSNIQVKLYVTWRSLDAGKMAACLEGADEDALSSNPLEGLERMQHVRVLIRGVRAGQLFLETLGDVVELQRAQAWAREELLGDVMRVWGRKGGSKISFGPWDDDEFEDLYFWLSG